MPTSATLPGLIVNAVQSAIEHARRPSVAAAQSDDDDEEEGEGEEQNEEENEDEEAEELADDDARPTFQFLSDGESDG